jgi:hypothetical protein
VSYLGSSILNGTVKIENDMLIVTYVVVGQAVDENVTTLTFQRVVAVK